MKYILIITSFKPSIQKIFFNQHHFLIYKLRPTRIRDIKMLHFSNFKRAMESDTISKNERSTKSQMGNRNFLVKIMNKKFLLLAFIAFLTASYAQAQVNYGARVGIGATGTGEGDAFEKYGFQIGGVAEFTLSDVWAIQPSLLFATQGDKKKIEFWGASASSQTNMYYIQLPVHLQYRLHLWELEGSKINLLIQAGPYLGYALGGKIITKESYGGKSSKEKEDIKFGNGKDYDYKPLDFGIGLNVGFQLKNADIKKNIQAVLGFNHGLTDISNSSKVTARNWSFMGSLIFMIGE